jgi:hypothetical protein
MHTKKWTYRQAPFKLEERKGANFAQIICKEVKKVLRKQSHKRKKNHANDSDSDSDSDYSS